MYFEQNGEVWGDPFDNLITHNGGLVAKAPVCVYPNPAEDEFVVEMESIGQYEFTLYNTAGNPVYTEELLSAKSRIAPDLKPGVYFYRISENNQTIHSGKILLK